MGYYCQLCVFNGYYGSLLLIWGDLWQLMVLMVIRGYNCCCWFSNANYEFLLLITGFDGVVGMALYGF